MMSDGDVALFPGSGEIFVSGWEREFPCKPEQVEKVTRRLIMPFEHARKHGVTPEASEMEPTALHG